MPQTEPTLPTRELRSEAQRARFSALPETDARCSQKSTKKPKAPGVATASKTHLYPPPLHLVVGRMRRQAHKGPSCPP